MSIEPSLKHNDEFAKYDKALVACGNGFGDDLAIECLGNGRDEREELATWRTLNVLGIALVTLAFEHACSCNGGSMTCGRCELDPITSVA